LLPQRSKHPREMVIMPKASTSILFTKTSLTLLGKTSRSRGSGREFDDHTSDTGAFEVE